MATNIVYIYIYIYMHVFQQAAMSTHQSQVNSQLANH